MPVKRRRNSADFSASPWRWTGVDNECISACKRSKSMSFNSRQKLVRELEKLSCHQQGTSLELIGKLLSDASRGFRDQLLFCLRVDLCSREFAVYLLQAAGILSEDMRVELFGCTGDATVSEFLKGLGLKPKGNNVCSSEPLWTLFFF